MTIDRRTADTGVARLPGTAPRQRVRLAGPAALVACLPELVGFAPEESLVVVGLSRERSGRDEVGLTLRVDLAAVRAALEHRKAEEDSLWDRVFLAPDDEEASARLHDLLLERSAYPSHPSAIARVLVRNGCSGALVVAVSATAKPPGVDGATVDPVADATLETQVALEIAGVRIADALLVSNGRWWSYRCRDAACCPPEGTPVRPGDADLLKAELVWAGERGPATQARSEIVALVAPRDDAASAAVRAELDRIPAAPTDRAAAVALTADLIERLRHGDDAAVAPQEWARLLVDLHDVVVRDACLATWKGAAGRRALDLWCAATRIAPPGHVAPPATMAAIVAHARGEGALAGEALDRAHADDPGYRMAGYAAQLLTAGMPPTVVRRTIVGATATLRARGEPVLDGRGRVAADARARPRRS